MSEGTYNRFLGGLRLAALFAVIVVLIYFAHPTVPSVALGFMFVLMGESVRFWSSGLLLKTKELMTAGPYRYTRNPLYLGRFLILTGVIIMVNLPNYISLVALALGWVWFLGVYMRRKERVEPARLRNEHGEAYDRYFAAVPALFPTFRPYRDYTPASWSLTRMLRNREYWMVFGLLGVTAYLLWRALTSSYS
jgi:protein-S-isoprenylcysteine O-methyltransferase Ste14